MTAEEMVLQYWGYEPDQDPNNLSVRSQEKLRDTVILMHTWEEHKLKKVKVDAAVYELLIASREEMIISRDKELKELKNDHLHLSKHNKDIIADLNAQRNQLKFKDEQLKDLKEKLGESIKKNWLLQKQIDDLQHNIRILNQGKNTEECDATEAASSTPADNLIN